MNIYEVLEYGPVVAADEDYSLLVTVNGAYPFRLEDRIGSLEVGKLADLVVRHESLPEALPGADPIRSMVQSSRSKSIDIVMVNGEVIVEKGHSIRVDEEEVYARSREATNDRECKQPGNRNPAQGRNCRRECRDHNE